MTWRTSNRKPDCVLALVQLLDERSHPACGGQGGFP
jgi:hypothetical protein